jgi:hypothetical protein
LYSDYPLGPSPLLTRRQRGSVAVNNADPLQLASFRLVATATIVDLLVYCTGISNQNRPILGARTDTMRITATVVFATLSSLALPTAAFHSMALTPTFFLTFTYSAIVSVTLYTTYIAAQPSFQGGICCAIEAGGKHGAEAGCSLALGFGVAGEDCGFEIPLGPHIRIAALANVFPPSMLTTGAGWCCGVGVNIGNGDCELDCSGSVGVGFQSVGRGIGPTRWKAPCSALHGTFNEITSFIPGIRGHTAANTMYGVRMRTCRLR